VALAFDIAAPEAFGLGGGSAAMANAGHTAGKMISAHLKKMA
jgi:hypothetical protein